MHNDGKQEKQSKEAERPNLNFKNVMNTQVRLLIFICVYVY